MTVTPTTGATSLLPGDVPREIPTSVLLDHLADRVATLRHGRSPSQNIADVLNRYQADLGHSPDTLGDAFVAIVRTDEYGDERAQAERAFASIAFSLPRRVIVTGWIPGEQIPGDRRWIRALTGDACPECGINPTVWADSSHLCLDQDGCGWAEPPF